MKFEKWAVYAILTLMFILAAVNVVSALTMLVLEKKKDISVLQSLGASKELVRRIFLTEGMLLGTIGSITGIMLAVVISLLQIRFKFIKLQGTSFLIDYFPVKLNFTDLLIVAATSLLIAFMASWLPAKKAAQQPFALKN